MEGSPRATEATATSLAARRKEVCDALTLNASLLTKLFRANEGPSLSTPGISLERWTWAISKVPLGAPMRQAAEELFRQELELRRAEGGPSQLSLHEALQIVRFGHTNAEPPPRPAPPRKAAARTSALSHSRKQQMEKMYHPPLSPSRARPAPSPRAASEWDTRLDAPPRAVGTPGKQRMHAPRARSPPAENAAALGRTPCSAGARSAGRRLQPRAEGEAKAENAGGGEGEVAGGGEGQQETEPLVSRACSSPLLPRFKPKLTKAKSMGRQVTSDYATVPNFSFARASRFSQHGGSMKVHSLGQPGPGAYDAPQSISAKQPLSDFRSKGSSFFAPPFNVPPRLAGGKLSPPSSRERSPPDSTRRTPAEAAGRRQSPEEPKATLDALCSDQSDEEGGGGATPATAKAELAQLDHAMRQLRVQLRMRRPAMAKLFKGAGADSMLSLADVKVALDAMNLPISQARVDAVLAALDKHFGNGTARISLMDAKRHLLKGISIARLVRSSGPKLTRDNTDETTARKLTMRELKLDLLTALDLEGDANVEGAKHVSSVLSFHAPVVIDLVKDASRNRGSTSVSEERLCDAVTRGLGGLARAQARSLSALLALVHREWLEERKAARGGDASFAVLVRNTEPHCLTMDEVNKALRRELAQRTRRSSPRANAIQLREIKSSGQEGGEGGMKVTKRGGRMSTWRYEVNKMSAAATKARERLQYAPIELEMLLDKLTAQEKNVLHLFKRRDECLTGVVSKDDFRKAMPVLGLGLIPREVVEELFNFMDLDGSGQITITELHQVLAWAKRRNRILAIVQCSGSTFTPDRDRPLQLQVAETVRASGKDPEEIFSAWDEDGDGTIDAAEFSSAMTLMGCQFGTAYLVSAFEAIDLDKSGRISFVELQTQLNAMSKVRQFIDQLVAQSENLRELFHTWDKTGSGSISKDDFRQACAKSGFEFEATVLDFLFDMLDVDKSGSISKLELTRVVRWFKSSTTAAQLSSQAMQEQEDVDIQRQLRDTLTANAVRVIDLFREWDEDGNGAVDKNEFRRALPLIGLDAPEDQVDKLFDSFDADGSGAIGFKELNRLLRRDVKAEEEAKVKKRKEMEENKRDVFIADVFILRKQMATEVMMLDPWTQLKHNENGTYHQRQVAEAAMRGI